MEMDSQGYPFPMATHSHSHSHLPHPASHAHFPRPHYPHPCGRPRRSAPWVACSLARSRYRVNPFFSSRSLCALVCIVINRPTRIIVVVVLRQGQRLRRLALSTRTTRVRGIFVSVVIRETENYLVRCCRLRICRDVLTRERRGESAQFLSHNKIVYFLLPHRYCNSINCALQRRASRAAHSSSP